MDIKLFLRTFAKSDYVLAQSVNLLNACFSLRFKNGHIATNEEGSNISVRANTDAREIMRRPFKMRKPNNTISGAGGV
jgi:hypothetical protein